MKRIEKILVATSLSQASIAGVSYALNLAKTLGAEVTVLHVLNYEDFVRYGKKLSKQIANDATFHVSDSYLKEYELALKRFLADHFSDLIPSVRVHQQVQVGDPDEEIVLEAKKQKADLIVLSARKRTGFSRFLKRDVSEKVSRKAPCPVLVIPVEQPQEKLQAA